MHLANMPTPPLQAYSEPMAPWQRRTLLAMLVVLATLFNATRHQVAQTNNTLYRTAIAGGGIAPASLLAVWGGLSNQALLIRFPVAIAIATVLALASVWGDTRSDWGGPNPVETILLMVLLAAMQATGLLLVRRYFKWELGVSGHARRQEEWRFGLRYLLLATLVVAALLLVARWTVPGYDLRNEMQIDEVQVLLQASIESALVLPVVISAVSFILGRRRRLHAAALLSVMAFASCAASTGIQSIEPESLPASLHFLFDLTFLAGQILILLCGLIVLRLCGLRLIRGAEHDTLAAAGEQASAQPQRERVSRRFLILAFVLAALIAILLWPAWKLEQRWQSRNAVSLSPPQLLMATDNRFGL